jgi:hypothetical protein
MDRGLKGCEGLVVETSDGAPGTSSATAVFFIEGQFRVTFKVADKLGATNTQQSAIITVVDAPLRFITPAPALATGSQSEPQCRAYLTGAPVAIALGDGKAPPVVDEDAHLAMLPTDCDKTIYEEKITYQWDLLGAPSHSAAVIVAKNGADCPAKPPAGAQASWVPGDGDDPFSACIYPDLGGAFVPIYYRAQFSATNRGATIVAGPLSFPVVDDQPPCMTGASPLPGAYVVDRAELQHFLITGVDDDHDPFGSDQLTFIWSLWRQSDPVWRDVPLYSLPSYTLDASGFAVGETVRVRAEAVDRTGVRSTCDLMVGDCYVESCQAPGAQCQTRITWDLELR